MDAALDVNELMETIAQQIAQQVQTQMTELDHLMGDLEQRIDTLETRSRKS
jgi:prefoldin subunit 5